VGDSRKPGLGCTSIFGMAISQARFARKRSYSSRTLERQALIPTEEAHMLVGKKVYPQCRVAALVEGGVDIFCDTKIICCVAIENLHANLQGITSGDRPSCGDAVRSLGDLRARE